MEVHHHPDLHHRRKKFKEYFLEFLMIFLAVTMGFIAESLRENMSDKEKEKEYIVGFINNVKDDTAQLASVIGENEDKLDTLKRLMNLSRANMKDTAVRRSIYRFVTRAVGFYSVFKSNDATMMQLKNSGGLRFIRKDHVADSIARYDTEMKNIYGAEGLYMTASDGAVDATHEVLDYTFLYDSTFFKGKQGEVLLPFLTDDPHKMRWMFNKVAYEMGGTKNYLNNLHERMPFMTRLIGFLRKEYDIE